MTENTLRYYRTVGLIRDERDKSVLHPYYWGCPVDFTGRSRRTGTVGRVFRSQMSERFFDYRKDDPESDRVVRSRNGQVYEAKVKKHPVDARELVW